MKLHYSPASPFARKVMAVAAELGLPIEVVTAAAHPVNRNRELIKENPLGQVPTLIADDGAALYDSRVICEYLAAQVPGSTIFPAAGPARWQALVEQALADGLLGAALLVRYEQTVRPEEKRWDGWQDGQMDKVASALDRMDGAAAAFGDRVDIGTIAIGCALGYLDFRFTGFDWRGSRPVLAEWYAGFARRPAMVSTEPKG
jgi:glutathione S-transferase